MEIIVLVENILGHYGVLENMLQMTREIFCPPKALSPPGRQQFICWSRQLTHFIHLYNGSKRKNEAAIWFARDLA